MRWVVRVSIDREIESYLLRISLAGVIIHGIRIGVPEGLHEVRVGDPAHLGAAVMVVVVVVVVMVMVVVMVVGVVVVQ